MAGAGWLRRRTSMTRRRWDRLGVRLGAVETPSVRVYLAGRVSVEASGSVMPSDQFPGQQGRVAFAYLALERARPVTHGELAQVLSESLPPAWEAALSAIVSKLRSAIARSGLAGAISMKYSRGAYGCRSWPTRGWTWRPRRTRSTRPSRRCARGTHVKAYGPERRRASHRAPPIPRGRGRRLDRSASRRGGQ